MTYQKRNKRTKNWRASKNHQMFCAERNFRTIEKMFWYYTKIKQAIREEEESREVYLSSGGGNANHTDGTISNPTERIAMEILAPIPSVRVTTGFNENTEKIEQPREWVRVVDETLAFFSQNDSVVSDVLKSRYLLDEGSPKTCMQLEITTNNYYRARDAGLQYARECAIQLGLLRAF